MHPYDDIDRARREARLTIARTCELARIDPSTWDRSKKRGYFAPRSAAKLKAAIEQAVPRRDGLPTASAIAKAHASIKAWLRAKCTPEKFEDERPTWFPHHHALHRIATYVAVQALGANGRNGAQDLVGKAIGLTSGRKRVHQIVKQVQQLRENGSRFIRNLIDEAIRKASKGEFCMASLIYLLFEFSGSIDSILECI